MPFVKSSVQNHGTKLAYDRIMRYLFIVSALLLTVIIAAIIVFVGQQGVMTFIELNPADFFSPKSGTRRISLAL